MSCRNMYYRTHQFLFCNAQKMLPWPKPRVMEGKGCLLKLPLQVKADGVNKVMVVTTAGFIRRGSLQGLFEEMDKASLEYVIYDQVKPDPVIESIEATVTIYKKEGCQGIIAVGGGSVMDCSKMVGARVVKPSQSISQMAGLLKVRKKLPPLYAVPTTAGTGSETTVAAVVTDSATHRKYAVSDTCLMPHYAVLDPALTCGLPKKLTATTGMDALTHALEAYTNKFSSQESRNYALDATKLIFENLKNACENGGNLKYRENMLKASFYAGAAFTKAYVGYVHAIAHAIGGLYGVPHGMANAVILPVVLEEYGKGVYRELSELAEAIGIKGSSEKERAVNFVKAIRDLNHDMGIPEFLEEIREEDIPEIVRRATVEANPTYPVPVIWNEEEFTKVVKKLMK